MLKLINYILFFSLTFSSFSQKKWNFLIADILQFRDEINAQYKDSVHSPLTKAVRDQFTTLPFFSIDTNYYIRAKFVKIEKGRVIKMKTSTSRKPTYRVYGKAIFTLRDTNHEILLYQNIELVNKEGFEDFLFFPFNDFTNGGETYGGGRYLDLKIPQNDELILDFNKAYNPYCAYTDGYSCPIPQKENSLQTYIKAGVKYSDEDH